MLQVDHFFHFIELLLPMSIYNLHHLNCTMEDEEMQKKKKKRYSREPGKAKPFVFPLPWLFT